MHNYPTEKTEVEKELNKKGISLSDDFINISSKATLVCNICGFHWQARVLDVLKQTGCPRCSNRYSPSPEEFSLWMINNHPEISLLSDYHKSNEPVSCQCNICKTIWNPRPADIKKGQGCPKCGRKKASSSRINYAKVNSFDKFCKHRNDITFLEEYRGSQVSILCKCNICGHTWKVQPISILQGHGCPNCAKNSTSFMEQFLYHSFCVALGKTNVLTRNRDIIGKELDIVLPSVNYAIEIGAWNWHKDHFENDIKKLQLCKIKNIQLLVIYDSFHEKNKPFSEALTFPYDLASEKDHLSLKTIVNNILTNLNIGKLITENEFAIIESAASLTSKKTNTDTFKLIMLEINKNILIQGPYISNNVPIECKCLVCNFVWNARPSDLKKGHGCPKCASVYNGIKHRIQPQEFESWLKENKPTIELIEAYQTATTPIKVKCKICGCIWSPKPSSLKAGSGCPQCGGTRKQSHQEFSEWLAIHRPNFMIVEGHYFNNKSRIHFMCKKCMYIWESSPNMIKNKRAKGCPRCHEV